MHLSLLGYLLDVKCSELSEREVTDPPIGDILSIKNSGLLFACEFRAVSDVCDSG